MKPVIPEIEGSWKKILSDAFNAETYKVLMDFVQQERESHLVYPPNNLVFEAFNQTFFEDVKVVILGQDPYHGQGQAHGLSFSVPPGVKSPPSLRNIFKELESDLGEGIPMNNCLDHWAKQGVLLLNATLTVRSKTPGSHQNKGWEEFTDEAIQKLSKEKKNIVFILWGSYAQKKGEVIDEQNHLVIKSAHPSPFSAHRGFLGSKPFSTTNQYLKGHNVLPIEWVQ